MRADERYTYDVQLDPTGDWREWVYHVGVVLGSL